MGTDYEKTYRYVIDDFSGGMDLASTRFGIKNNAGREASNLIILPDGALAPRPGLFPIAVASHIGTMDANDIYDAQSEYLASPTKYIYHTMGCGPFIHVISDEYAPALLLSYRFDRHSLAIYNSGEAYTMTSWQLFHWGLMYETYYKKYQLDENNNITEYGHNESVYDLMKSYDNYVDGALYYHPDYVDNLDGLYIDPDDFESDYTAPVTHALSGLFTEFNGQAICVDAEDSITLFAISRYGDMVNLSLSPAVASLWGDESYATLHGMAHWQDRLFTLDYKKRIWFSAILDPTTWGAVDYLDIAGMDGGAPVGLLALSDKLMIATSTARYVVFGDSPETWVIRRTGERGVSAAQDLTLNSYMGTTEVSPPLWCVGPNDAVYFIGDDYKLYLWDGYKEIPFAIGIPEYVFRHASALAVHDSKLYLSAWMATKAEDQWGEDGEGYPTMKLGEGHVFNTFTYVYDFASRALTRIPYCFTAFATIVKPRFSDSATHMKESTLVGLLGVAPPQYDVSQYVGMQAVGFDQQDKIYAHSIVVIDDTQTYYAEDVVYSANIVDDETYDKRVIRRACDVLPVVGEYISKDIDFGLPSNYKLLKGITINVTACHESYMRARIEDEARVTTTKTWAETGYVEVAGLADAGAQTPEGDVIPWVEMGTYSIPMGHGSMDNKSDAENAETTASNGSPEEYSPKNGVIRIIPPVYGTVLCKQFRFRIRLKKCVLRSVTLEYAVRGNAAPTAISTGGVTVPMEVY